MEHVTGESTRTACKETITSGRRLNGTLEVDARVSNSDGRVRLESEYQHTSQQGRRGLELLPSFSGVVSFDRRRC